MADHILDGADKTEFLDKFAHAHSVGFDPGQDLEKVGIANQTNMFKSETEQIGKLLAQTILKKYGPLHFNNYFS